MPGFGEGGGGSTRLIPGIRFLRGRGASGGGRGGDQSQSLGNAGFPGERRAGLGDGADEQRLRHSGHQWNVVWQMTNNLLGAQLYADLTISSNLWFYGDNPTLHNHGTAQWSGNLNVAGGFTVGGNPLLAALSGQGSNNVFNGTVTTNGTNVGRFPTWTNSAPPYYVQPG